LADNFKTQPHELLLRPNSAANYTQPLYFHSSYTEPIIGPSYEVALQVLLRAAGKKEWSPGHVLPYAVTGDVVYNMVAPVGGEIQKLSTGVPIVGNFGKGLRMYNT